MDTLSNEDLVKALNNLTAKQLVDLTKDLEQAWGVKATPQMVEGGPKQDEPKQEVVQTEFNVILAVVPADKKMACLKVVRELTGLGLKEAKDFVESVPKMLKEGVSKEDAEQMKAKLTEAGGTVEVK